MEVTDALSQQAVSPTGAVVSIADAVLVTVPPVSAIVPVNSSHVFTVTATGGHGALQYDWRRNGVSLGAPSQPYLAINPVTAANEGTYDVVVTDQIGLPPSGVVISPDPAATLTVSYPLIVTGPAGVIAYADDAQVVFEVTATGGVAPYAYTWQHNGTDLAPALQPGGPQLTLAVPLAGQAGTYRCMVTDTAVPSNTTPSETATLAVYPRLQVTQQPQGGSFYRDATVVLQATVTGGVPTLTYVWRKDGEPLPFEQQPNGTTLTLTNVQLSDTGVYDLVVYDGYTDDETSSAATVTVMPPPPLTIVTPPQGGTVKIGGASLLSQRFYRNVP